MSNAKPILCNFALRYLAKSNGESILSNCVVSGLAISNFKWLHLKLSLKSKYKVENVPELLTKVSTI